jgi:RES domain-containing protein
LSSIPEASIGWAPCYRIIADRYPAINFFESVSADPSDWELLLEVEQMTDPTCDVGDLSALEQEDRLSGPGAGRILPSFTFHDPNGTRFSTPSFGAYYAAINFKTAVYETVHHRTLFMEATNEPAQDLDQLLILADLQGQLHDIRAMREASPEFYDPSDYKHSQMLANELRSAGSHGLVYKSVRNLNGECVAIWRARVLANARDDRHITYRWDGTKITGYFDKSNYRALP